MPLLGLLLVSAACAGVDDPDGWAPPAVIGDTLYLSIDDGELSAIDPATFERSWVFPDADEVACGDEEPQTRELDGLYSAPVVEGDTVYFGAWDGNVYALDAATGDCLWDFETDDPILGSVVLDGDRLYAASTDGTLYVLDAASGELTDSADVGDVWSSPVLVDGTLFIGSMDGDLRALDAETLDLVWDEPFSVNAGLLTDPTPLNGTIVVGGISEKLYAVDAATGEEQWSFGAGNWFWGRPLVDGDTVYATNMDKAVYAISLDSGDQRWGFGTDAPVRSGPVLTGDVLVAVDDKGHVYGLDPETGELAWNSPTELDKDILANPYVLEDGSVLIVSKGGDVFSIDPETGRVTTIRINK
jgi:outer membrane protein assembly factor BamB